MPTVFETDQRVASREPGNDDRLELAASPMMDELADVLREDRSAVDRDYAFRLVSRRLNNVLNSCGRNIPRLAGKGYNPAFLHPDDLAALVLRRATSSRCDRRMARSTRSWRRTRRCGAA